MSTVDLRCPSCGALARGELAWCTLCHADLRPAPPVAEPPVAAPPGPVPLDPLTAPLDQVLAAAPAAPAVPDPVESPAATPGELAALDTEVMFALLRGQSQDPLLAKFGNRFETKGSRFALMAGGATLLALVFFGLITVVGLVVG